MKVGSSLNLHFHMPKAFFISLKEVEPQAINAITNLIMGRVKGSRKDLETFFKKLSVACALELDSFVIEFL